MFVRHGNVVPLDKNVKCDGCANKCNVNKREFCKKAKEQEQLDKLAKGEK